MARTFLQQETQIRSTPAAEYDDSIVPTLADYETNPTNLQQDLNNLRSQAHNLLKNMAGNWYDDLNVPNALDPGTQRGVNDVNTDLHELERKRVLVQIWKIYDVTVPTQAKATGTFSSSGVFSDGETVTIGSRTYTFKSPFVDAANNIDASGTTAQTHENLRRAIKGDGVAGVNYGTGTLVNTQVTATDTASTNVITALAFGTAANAFVTLTTCSNATFGGPTTLTGGAGDVSVLGVGEIPTGSGATGAVGAVTTRGAVCAYVSNFGVVSLNEVAGSNAVSPKNLAHVVDSVTHDPILSSGREVHALFQSEFSADGTTITTTMPDRVQLTYVRATGTGDDLELCPVADIQGKTIHYAFVERKALDDLNEEDFLKGASVDVGTTSVTRQSAYDNQGTVPVDVITHSILDLEGPGLYWKIRDDLQADLFTVTEGSAGGTSTVALGADVDTFDNNAVSNDFLNGAAFDTGAASTTINVGITPNQIDSLGELTVASGTTGGVQDLNLVAADELNLTDRWRATSTWSLADGLALSSSAAEWSLFETNFGEVSLLNAINQAYASAAGSARGTKTYANVLGNYAAGTSISLFDGRLDAALPDMSQGSFLAHDVYLNGALLRPEVSYPGANDYGPGASLNPARLLFEFKLKTGDVICVVPWNP